MENNELSIKIKIENYEEVIQKLENIKKLLNDIKNTKIEVK